MFLSPAVLVAIPSQSVTEFTATQSPYSKRKTRQMRAAMSDSRFEQAFVFHLRNFRHLAPCVLIRRDVSQNSLQGGVDAPSEKLETNNAQSCGIPNLENLLANSCAPIIEIDIDTAINTPRGKLETNNREKCRQLCRCRHREK